MKRDFRAREFKRTPRNQDLTVSVTNFNVILRFFSSSTDSNIRFEIQRRTYCRVFTLC